MGAYKAIFLSRRKKNSGQRDICIQATDYHRKIANGDLAAASATEEKKNTGNRQLLNERRFPSIKGEDMLGCLQDKKINLKK